MEKGSQKWNNLMVIGGQINTKNYGNTVYIIYKSFELVLHFILSLFDQNL